MRRRSWLSPLVVWSRVWVCDPRLSYGCVCLPLVCCWVLGPGRVLRFSRSHARRRLGARRALRVAAGPLIRSLDSVHIDFSAEQRSRVFHLERLHSVNFQLRSTGEPVN